MNIKQTNSNAKKQLYNTYLKTNLREARLEFEPR